MLHMHRHQYRRNKNNNTHTHRDTKLGCARSLQQAKYFLFANVRKRPSDPSQRANVSGARVPSHTNSGEAIHIHTGIQFIRWHVCNCNSVLIRNNTVFFIFHIDRFVRCVYEESALPHRSQASRCWYIDVFAFVVCALSALFQFCRFVCANCMNAERKKERVFSEVFCIAIVVAPQSLYSVCTQTFLLSSTSFS